MNNEKENFIKNYTGIFIPEVAYEQCQKEKLAEELLTNATYNDDYNKQLVRDSKKIKQ